MLNFDAESHVYRWNGLAVPSVTQVLGAVGIPDLSAIPAGTLEAARVRGTRVHKLCELYDLGELDESSLDEIGRGYLEQWKKAREAMGGFTWIEKPLYSQKYGYAGTPDRVQILERSKTALIWDIKTGMDNGAAAPQLAGYANLVQENSEIRIRTVTRKVVLLNPDDYDTKPLTCISDWSVFQSALNIYRYKKGGR